jgi:hypothetical protein
MENNLKDLLNFDEEKINYLLENADKLPLVLSQEQIDKLMSLLKTDVQRIDDIIKELETHQDEDNV